MTMGYQPNALALALALAATVAGCAASAPPEPPRVAPAPPTSAPKPVPSQASVSEPPTPPEPTSHAGPPFVAQVPELSHFHEALFRLETRERRDHVRIAWLGDSHGQADFWSGRVRRELQKRFGDGGPGYVALGYKNYRHEGVALEIAGKWRMRPKQPQSAKPVGDGVYGLAGLLMGGYAGGPSVTVTYETAPTAQLRYDLCFKAKADGESAGAEGANALKTALLFGPKDVGTLSHLIVTTDAPLRVLPFKGSPDFCGAVIEAPPSRPGVVLDQLAFNGARYGTPLAWDETSWARELKRRSPDLVILEYGGNEAGDAAPAVKKIGEQVEELVARVRRVKPDADCLVVSPTDRADAEERVPLVVAAVKEAAARARCATFDAYAVGGGKGSAAARRDETKPRVQKDGVHLTIRGYEEMGEAMTRMLLDRYQGPTRAEASGPSSARGAPVSRAATSETPLARATPSR